MPALSIFDGMVLHKDELLCLCHILFLRFDTLGSVVKILHLRIHVNRIPGLAPDIFYDTAKPAVSRFRLLRFFLSFGKQREKSLVDIRISLAHLQRMPIETDQQIERCPENRNNQNHQHPGHTDRCSLVAAVNAQHEYS